MDNINKLPNSKTVNLTVNQTVNNSNFIGPTKSNGTASADGTAIAGHSFAKGNWGIKDSGTALVGELGQELLVRNGHYYTIGDDSAEFVRYQKGDIIFIPKDSEIVFATPSTVRFMYVTYPANWSEQ